MAIRSITQLKKWFRQGMYPTESQFADWMESYWHKEEDRIPMSTVDGLPEAINAKYDATAGKEIEREQERLKADLAAHKIENENAFNGIYEDIEDLEVVDEEIKADLAGVHQDITGLQTADTAIRADIQALQQTDTEIKQDISNLQASDVQIIGQIGTTAAETLQASKSYTSEKIAEVVGGSPEALDTLYELSKALNDDPNFSATIMTQIGNKADVGHTHTAGQVQEDATHRFVTDAEKTAWNEKVPSAHQHTISDVNGLQDALNNKFDKTGGDIAAPLGVKTIAQAKIYLRNDNDDNISLINVSDKNNGSLSNFGYYGNDWGVDGEPLWHSGNLNPADFFPATGGKLKGEGSVDMTFVPVGSHARGIYYKNPATGAISGGIGGLGINGELIKLFLGFGTAPWNGPGLLVSPNSISFNNKEIATVDHTHAGYVSTSDARLSDARPANGGNADTVDGLHAAAVGTVEFNKLASYSSNGYFNAIIYKDSWPTQDADTLGQICFRISKEDGFHRWCSVSRLKDVLGSMPANGGNSTTVGDAGMSIIPQFSNEINFGCVAASGTINFGYRATGAKPVPSQYIFGNTSNGSAEIRANNFLLAGRQVVAVDGMNNGSFIRINSNSSWAYFSIATGGRTQWDLACTPANNNDLEFRPDGASSALTISKNKVFHFYGGGSIDGSVSATAGFFDTSDSRLKENIKPIGLQSDRIRLYEFDKQGRHSAGVIAQEIEQLYPWAVKEGEDGYKTVNYNEVLSLKCAELERENEELRFDLESEKSQMLELKERIGKLEQLLQIK